MEGRGVRLAASGSQRFCSFRYYSHKDLLPGLRNYPMQAPNPLWEKSWRGSAPQCMSKFLLMQFGWISCGQELAHCIAVPSRASETIPSSGVEVLEPLSSGMAFGSSVPALIPTLPLQGNRNPFIWGVLVKVQGGNKTRSDLVSLGGTAEPCIKKG